MTDFLMPSLGADMEAGTLVQWKKKPGDQLTPGDIIAEVETQKGLIEIEIFEAGILESYLIEEGDKVPVGSPMARLRPEGSSKKTPETHPIQEKSQASKPLAAISEKTPSESSSSQKKTSEEIPRIKISPLARSIAEKNGIDLSSITGSGEGGAIIKADVEKAMVAKAGEPAGKETREAPSTAKTIPQESIRTAVAAAMSRSNREIPHYYLEKRIDMLAAMTWLQEVNRQRKISERLLPVVLFIKAVAKALESSPELNGIWDNGLQIQNQVNIGFVISLRAGGLLVPAIRDADLKSPEEIMAVLNELIPRARALKLRSSELSDSTITITSLGENGADKVFGVIYPPQVAIVGFGSIINEAVVHEGMLAIRPVVHVSLAGDHRATDGLSGSRFLEALNNNLQNPNAL
ncbi:dihydrolipoamide acetyltransferase family protein [Salegentibacter sediminis]|uniref:dihydrolipoamide acetyltransferase family protein n=1 Tax=Salegentibacter sediminis TaxID=1930251 RepID=UPI0009C10DBB|nr:dihydrolipoamide acetyltransferase family protein [Salegentibacter sediminis]